MAVARRTAGRYAGACGAIAAGGGPISLELSGGRRRYRALDIERQVEPWWHILRSTEVLRRKVASACPQDPVVGNRPFPVVAQIARTRGLACQQWTEDRRFHAGCAQARKPTLRQLNRAHAVKEKSHSYTAGSAGHHRRGRFIAECIVAQEEGADVQPLIGAAHQFKQGGTGLGAVLMHAHQRRGGGRQSEALDEVFSPMLGVRADPGWGRAPALE